MKIQAVNLDKRLHSQHPPRQFAMTIDVAAEVQVTVSSKEERKKSKKHRREEATAGGRYVIYFWCVLGVN